MSRKTKALWRVTAAAAVGVSAIALTANGVVARGPDVGSQYEILLPNFFKPRAAPAERPPTPDAAPFRDQSRPREMAITGQAICVRLCDGAYFPIAASAGDAAQDAECRRLCPDAETATYIEPSGTDDVGGALSRLGRPYAELPTALRYRTKLDRACACHHGVAPRYSVADDPTLRKGDYVMTRNGLVAFEGGASPPHVARDFVAIGDAQPKAGRIAVQGLKKPHTIARGRIRITTP